MSTRPAGRGCGARVIAAVMLAFPLLPVACTAPKSGWAKPGADQAAIASAAADCRDQANAAAARQGRINQDISATLGGNWQRARTSGIMDQSLRSEAGNSADQVFDGCMHSKGFRQAP
ncbi:MAG TPA: hypothetical protein VMF05_08530 [Stellaceae bacterium]|nr:hypothetical protein [Stellaceae bacterium]